MRDFIKKKKKTLKKPFGTPNPRIRRFVQYKLTFSHISKGRGNISI